MSIKVLKLVICAMLITSCQSNKKSNPKYAFDEQSSDKIDLSYSNQHEYNTITYADSIYISNTWVKTYFNYLDSITPYQIEKERIDGKYPFFKINNDIIRKYIKCYHEFDDPNIYAISKQYSNENFETVILLYGGDCIWNVLLITIDKKNGDYIDSYTVLYDGTGCASESIEQEMKTFFKGNEFETTNKLEYYEDEDYIIENVVTKGEILPNGSIKTEIQHTKQVETM